MVKINLLPWREERRKQRQQEFYAMLGGAAVVGVLLSGLGWMWLNGHISGQQERNAFLEQEIQKVEQEIKEIETLQQKRESLLNRKQVIEELQANRFQMVHLFDSLMRTVPDGLVLTGLKQDGESLTLEGRAQSNTRVATYMRNLENSGWMKNPDVSVIEVTQPQGQGSTTATPAGNAASVLPYMFTMRVTLGNPEEPRDPNAMPTPDPVPVKVEEQQVIAPLVPAAEAAATPASDDAAQQAAAAQHAAEGGAQ
ncbi:fimbrial protein [Lysobacteraceae bacterium NML75-0749]|nr:fimbrial protein [Xanthomonadaceae bacterium NML75-0749]PJK04956.1 fimbrial protein [Xanthomonadaceae bacterium NML91-0268]